MDDAAAAAPEARPKTALPGRPYPPSPRAEHAWPVFFSLIAAIGLQVLLPSRLTRGPSWLLPALEGLLLVGLVLWTPERVFNKPHTGRRRLAISLTALVSLANIDSLVLLTRLLLQHGSPNPRQLISAGALIWLTNVIIFGLWYWEIDRGGPGLRAAGQDRAPDFLFPQMNDDRVQPLDWRPGFVDYLYVSLTNATAFSPTDTMPLTQRVKGMMGLQSLVSLVTIGLVLARAVNILQ